MAERRYGDPSPRTDNTLAGADWYGRQIERERRENRMFVDLDLTEAQAIFHEMNLPPRRLDVRRK